MGENLSGNKPSKTLGAAFVLLRAFAARARVTPRRVRDARSSRAAVGVTSDFGVAPIFPGMK